MIKVITYGTYDLLHYGHIRLLERAKALGDYLIVGITADGFDRARGKINVQQTLMERVEAVKATGLADEIIIEEYEGQKIDDIKRLGVDIFTVGSDWKGHFDYLNEFCKVIYLDRTKGVSSTEIRSERGEIRLGLVGDSTIINKFVNECRFVNGIHLVGLCSSNTEDFSKQVLDLPLITHELDKLLDKCDAVYIVSHPRVHYQQIKKCLERKKHVLCESPITTDIKQYQELVALAEKRECILMDAIKTAYSTAYYRLLLLVKSGRVGEVVSVDTICTSLSDLQAKEGKDKSNTWNSICAWGPTAMLPIFQILGTQYSQKIITSKMADFTEDFDVFTKISFVYPHAIASIKVGKGVKSEGELIVSGTKGYIYVPAPWWKTDYFEIRYENPADNKRYFYQLEGEGIRFELVSFVKAINQGKSISYVTEQTSLEIVKIINDFYNKKITTI